jgi:hypothetical protein
MTISSRTPEGEPNYCPICNVAIRIEPSRPPGDAPCPSCGVLLWFHAPVRVTRPRVQTFFARDGTGRPLDEQGNVLDPITGAIDFAATFDAAREASTPNPVPAPPSGCGWLWRWLFGLRPGEARRSRAAPFGIMS